MTAYVYLCTYTYIYALNRKRKSVNGAKTQWGAHTNSTIKLPLQVCTYMWNPHVKESERERERERWKERICACVYIYVYIHVRACTLCIYAVRNTVKKLNSLWQACKRLYAHLLTKPMYACFCMHVKNCIHVCIIFAAHYDTFLCTQMRKCTHHLSFRLRNKEHAYWHTHTYTYTCHMSDL